MQETEMYDLGVTKLKLLVLNNHGIVTHTFRYCSCITTRPSSNPLLLMHNDETFQQQNSSTSVCKNKKVQNQLTAKVVKISDQRSLSYTLYCEFTFQIRAKISLCFLASTVCDAKLDLVM